MPYLDEGACRYPGCRSDGVRVFRQLCLRHAALVAVAGMAVPEAQGGLDDEQRRLVRDVLRRAWAEPVDDRHP